MQLSIIIPVYNEEKLIESTIKKIKIHQKDSEIIIINDGSSDSTKKILSNINNVTVINNDQNKGKGYSIKQGIFQATKDYILFLDADFSTPIEELDKFLPNLDYDIIIGSRNLPQSKITKQQPLLRKSLGKIFPFFASFLVKDIHDTQCGFKLFKTEVAKDIFSKTKINGFCFDVEVLYLAQKANYQIKEIPITWNNDPNSKVKLLKDPIKMLLDLVKIKYYHS